MGGSSARQSRLRPGGPFSAAAATAAAFGRIHRDREKSQALNLHQGRRTVGDLEHALDDFTRPATGLIRKLRHIADLLLSSTSKLAKSCAIPSGNLARVPRFTLRDHHPCGAFSSQIHAFRGG